MAQERALRKRVQRDLYRPGLRQPVEQLEDLDTVVGERRDAVALGDAERRDAGRELVRARVHRGEGERVSPSAQHMRYGRYCPIAEQVADRAAPPRSVLWNAPGAVDT